MSLQDVALLLMLSFLWGGAFFLAAVAVTGLPPLTVVLARCALAAGALALGLRLAGMRWPLQRAARGPFLIMGFLNNLLPFSLLFWAQTVIPSGLAAILNATTPVFAAVAAHVLLPDEPMARHRMAGMAFGFLGVVVLLGGGGVAGGGLAGPGMLACLAAALSYGLAGTYGRRFRGMGLAPAQVALGQLAATTLMMAPVVAVVERPWTLAAPPLSVGLAVLVLALASTALAYVIFFRLLASAGAVNTALVTLLIPASAILLGALFLGETLDARHYAGLALISAGLVAMDGRVLAWRRR
ncbi:DMT family transporter [Rhodobacter sp. ETT8]|uniref:DMT family transporter n=2 Tax=Pseudotabrizicola algicola TaxID=2709381 RepID=A0A6B3RI15_9RHOB|nr:DMT family transporter [Pseudotabrizicola algicola]